jgi:hypothetical protein
MLTTFLRIKTTTPYEILLAETGLYLVELETRRKLILYRQKMRDVDSKRVPSMISIEVLKRRKYIWELQCRKLLEN